MGLNLRARVLDWGLLAAGLAITWAFPVLLRILTALDFQTVSPDRYPDRR